VAAGFAAGLLAGCGGSQSHTTSAGASSTAAAAASNAGDNATSAGASTSGPGSARRSGSSSDGRAGSASGDRSSVSSQTIVKSHDRITSGPVTERPASGTGGSSANDDNNPGLADAGGLSKRVGKPAANMVNPCTLVSQAEARTITGEALGAPVEAPLGPTCLYMTPGHKTSITLTLEPINFAQVKAHVRHTQRLDIQGREAYCGNYGRPTVFVPLNGGQMLTVTASCTVGRQFAATALARLKA
jgi:hypothetical protein